MYQYGLIGNCQVSALISASGSVDWLCLPRPDSEPIFGRLLDPQGGHFSIDCVDPKTNKAPLVKQRYLENTCILVTQIESSDGSVYKITDFCPRFEQHGRMYRPMSLFRIVEPISGSPVIKVDCRPINGWAKSDVKAVRGNSHLRFDMRDDVLRLTTTMPITFLCEGTPFPLKEKLYFGLTWSGAIEEDLVQLSERFLVQTMEYWKTWVKHCSIPSLFQKETIRSALTLKLHCYEDTGAILAALTTSLPEEVGSERNWDYRYCWLRDAYFVLSAFHKLGHFEEMEKFIKFLLSIALQNEASRERLAPVYTLSQTLPIPEMIHESWVGYGNSKPVRSNNQASEHVQNDVYGEMILTLAPIFFDERFFHLRSMDHEDLLTHLTKLCVKSIGQRDAGLWELRSGWQEHTFTNLMSWAGLDRVSRIQKAGYLKNLTLDVQSELQRAVTAVNRSIVDGSLRNGPHDPSFDASLALASVLRYPDQKVLRATVEEVKKNLAVDSSSGFYYRYTRKDDFGKPHAAFVICSFWVAQGLAIVGKREDAHKVLLQAMSSANSLGLYSEHFRPEIGTQTGNFPQAYSHVGLINSAFEISPPWGEML